MRSKQLRIFKDEPRKDTSETSPGKSYRALRHEVVRQKQRENSDEVHHPDEKIAQIKTVFESVSFEGRPKILELFAGRGNCTRIYKEHGDVLAYDKKAPKNRRQFY